MPTYNGALTAAFSKAAADGTGTSFSIPVSALPMKFLSHIEIGVLVTGVSATGVSVTVIGGVGGCTYAIARRQNITAAGSFPVPLIVYGISGNDPSFGIPRPYGVEFHSTTAGNSFTATTYIAGEY